MKVTPKRVAGGEPAASIGPCLLSEGVRQTFDSLLDPRFSGGLGGAGLVGLGQTAGTNPSENAGELVGVEPGAVSLQMSMITPLQRREGATIHHLPANDAVAIPPLLLVDLVGRSVNSVGADRLRVVPKSASTSTASEEAAS